VSSDALAAVESILRNSLLASSILRKFAFALSIFFYVCGSVAFWALRRPPAIRA